MFKSVVFGDLMSHQMFRFYHDLGLTDTTSWSDISYDRVEIILRTMKEEIMQGQVDPLALTPPNQNITSESDDAPKPTIASIFRPKKGSEVLECVHYNLHVHLIYHVHNFAFKLHR